MHRIIGDWIDEIIWLVCAVIMLRMYFDPKQTRVFRKPFTLVAVGMAVLMAVVGVVEILRRG